MRKQQMIWLSEHTSQAALPTMAQADPTSGVLDFTDWLNDRSVNFSGRLVDIGAGKGRNSLHFAALGFEVWALEYIKQAIDVARQLAKSRQVDERLHFELTEVDKHWDVEDEFFDVAIDSFSSIDIETKEGREICRNEMYRTLKIGGYALVNVCSADDEWEKELIAKHPGPEPSSTLWPQNGKFQKDYSEEELREFYKAFDIIELKKMSKSAHKLGRDGIATNYWVVLLKN
jgi:SAM-dependent methyltransferase